ncbi:unnamed protein product [Fraxinus pennsylvanica]|uniref:Uncharacterized protein n=1 Tax=Fraxinus pennsylvanica TaxID=56036 RepID=A0AAD1ZPP1_9LAMI|nr:unnamed protein product [Fraxinus pennsylvanica]
MDGSTGRVAMLWPHHIVAASMCVAPLHAVAARSAALNRHDAAQAIDYLVMEIEVYSGLTEEEGCSTPKQIGYRIPVRAQPPPPPRKKPYYVCGEKRGTPKNGYFHPPDLDHIFAMNPTHKA